MNYPEFHKESKNFTAEPIGESILVRMLPPPSEEVSDSGIVIGANKDAEDAKTHPIAVVVAAGPDAIKRNIVPGNLIGIVETGAMWKIYHKGERLQVLTHTSVFAVYSPTDKGIDIVGNVSFTELGRKEYADNMKAKEAKGIA